MQILWAKLLCTCSKLEGKYLLSIYKCSIYSSRPNAWTTCYTRARLHTSPHVRRDCWVCPGWWIPDWHNLWCFSSAVSSPTPAECSGLYVPPCDDSSEMDQNKTKQLLCDTESVNWLVVTIHLPSRKWFLKITGYSTKTTLAIWAVKQARENMILQAWSVPGDQ